MQFVLFDVGANWGTDSLTQTQANTDYLTYAFEPTPELAHHLRVATVDFQDRYNINEIALSDFDGTAKFNVAAHQDWGTSSLLKFSEGLNRTWPGRYDFYVDREIEVEVMRFDTWFRKTRPPIEKIDFFHCDTQGTDLKVLVGMGDYFGMIQQGVVEVPQSRDVMLYEGQHSKEDMLDFISDHGYEVFAITEQQNEDNLHFRTKNR